jgi:hypothetical protein
VATAASLTSLIPEDGTGVEFDPQVAFRQIPRQVLMDLGAKLDTVVHSARDGWLTFRIGASAKRRWRQVAVVYTADDLYDVEVNDLDLPTLTTTTRSQARGIGCEDLGRVIRLLVEEATGR